MYNSWRFYSTQRCYFLSIFNEKKALNVTSVGRRKKLKESRLRRKGWSSRRLGRKGKKDLASAYPQSIPSSPMSFHVLPNCPMIKLCLSKEWKVVPYHTIAFILYLPWNKLPTFPRHAVTVKPSFLDHDLFNKIQIKSNYFDLKLMSCFAVLCVWLFVV